MNLCYIFLEILIHNFGPIKKNRSRDEHILLLFCLNSQKSHFPEILTSKKNISYQLYNSTKIVDNIFKNLLNVKKLKKKNIFRLKERDITYISS